MEENHTPEGPAPIRRRRKASPNQTLPKIGSEKDLRALAMERINTNYFARRRILTVPPEIQRAHPDKHFVYVNLNELEKNGYWHPNGYEVFKASDSKLSGDEKERFQRSADGMVHRREMVLAWIPKEEFEIREMERQVLRGKRDIADVILKNPDLITKDKQGENFAPFVNHTTQKMAFPVKEATNG